MKILVISERYWPDGSGGELATHLIVGVLSRRFEVTVVTGSRNPSKLPNVEYVYEPLLSRWEKPALWLNTLKLVRKERFKRLLKEADVVYVPRFAFPVVPYAKSMGKKVIVHLHDYVPISYTAVILAPYEEHRGRITRDDVALECMKGLRHCVGIGLLWWLPRLARRWVSQADRILCVSRRHAEIISDQAPELREKIEIVYNPLPREILSAEPSKELSETPTFLYVGGDSYVKGFHVLLEALRKLSKQGIKAEFILTNTYNSLALKELRRLGESYGGLRIYVVGRVRYKILTNLHGQAWALIFPSIWEEPLPYAVAEAATLGTLPVSSKVGGVVELLSDTVASRFMFTHSKSYELAEKLRYLCSLSTSEVKAIGYKLRGEVLRRLDQREVEKKILKVFTSIAESRDE